MQTILGAGGSIGLEMARILPEYTDRIRLVSRNPKAAGPQCETWQADLLDPDQVMEAVQGSEIAYLMAGLPYKTKVWQTQWPAIMSNVIMACRASGSKLVFFDNIYMYDRDHLAAMDETTPTRPTSRKGAVRAEIADQLMTAVKRGELQALIARCADFYGPGKLQSSVLTQMVLERLRADKAGQWLLSLDHPHSFTYTPDAARGTAMLGNADDTFNEVWHLPTAPAPPTGRQWIEAIAAALGTEPKTQLVGDKTLRVMGLFVPVLREIREMAYQYDRSYVFNSDKFNRRFDYQPVGYQQGIEAIVEADYR